MIKCPQNYSKEAWANTTTAWFYLKDGRLIQMDPLHLNENHHFSELKEYHFDDKYCNYVRDHKTLPEISQLESVAVLLTKRCNNSGQHYISTE
jgi:hypothetical protein